MFKRSGKISFLIAIAVLIFIGCAEPQVSLPTPDLNLVRTEAVVTAVAQMTRQAALNPVPTQKPVIPTAQPLNTSTPIVITATTSIYGSGSGSARAVDPRAGVVQAGQRFQPGRRMFIKWLLLESTTWMAMFFLPVMNLIIK